MFQSTGKLLVTTTVIFLFSSPEDRVTGLPQFVTTTTSGANIRQCDTKVPCPGGAACVANRQMISTYGCFLGLNPTAQRRGSCPPAVFAPNLIANGGVRCVFDQQCPLSQRCCDLGGVNGLICTNPNPIPTTPTITPLINGSMIMGQGEFNFVASVTLVQSNGKNILYDTAGVSEKMLLVTALKNVGLYPDDIDFVITSHGHPDHYANINLFPTQPQNFDSFVITNDKFTPNTFGKSGTKYYVLGDQNLELWQTPGHTPQDTSLVVNNVPNLGKVLLAGDLILSEGDIAMDPAEGSYSPATARASRAKVACSADWIIPGHGPMFQSTPQYKQNFNCASVNNGR